MSRAFEEIDHQRTPMGDISLRRRLGPTLQGDVFEDPERWAMTWRAWRRKSATADKASRGVA